MKRNNKIARKRRVRAKVVGTGRPRLTVFRSNKKIYAQIIDDVKEKTLVSASVNDLDKLKLKGVDKKIVAEMVGTKIAEKAEKAKIKKIVFDRSGYKFHGRVKALAEAARKGGLKF
jgi:large subunit ribosomal protein L18